MNLIYYPGLDCYLASIVSIVDSLGINYKNAFFNLWSETDFFYHPKHQIYLSKRILPNLESLGIKIDFYQCSSPEETEYILSQLAEGELFLVGMETFHIPWSIVYQHFYHTHYFCVKYKKENSLFCFDPLYGQRNVSIEYSSILNHAFELGHIQKTSTNSSPFEWKQEMNQVLSTLPNLQDTLHTQIITCKNAERDYISHIIKLVTALINNRCLFSQFLHQSSFHYDLDLKFFDKDFFKRWNAVKHGLLKSTILSNNENTIDEVMELLLSLLHEEIAIANQII